MSAEPSAYSVKPKQRDQLITCSGFIKSVLPKFAAANPQIEFAVSPRPSKHPIMVRALYQRPREGNLRQKYGAA